MNKLTTIKEQWEHYKNKCISGNAPTRGFELMYYLGAGAYQNVLVTLKQEPDEKKQIEMLENITKEIQKRLYELTEIGV